MKPDCNCIQNWEMKHARSGLQRKVGGYNPKVVHSPAGGYECSLNIHMTRREAATEILSQNTKVSWRVISAKVSALRSRSRSLAV